MCNIRKKQILICLPEISMMKSDEGARRVTLNYMIFEQINFTVRIDCIW